MRLILIGVAFVVGLSSSPVLSQEVVQIAAIVGDDAISTIDIARRLKLALFSSGLPNEASVRQKLVPQIMQKLIDERLLAGEARKAGIQVSEQEMQRALASLEEKNQLPEGSFLSFMASNGIDVNTVREQLEAQIIWSKLVNMKIRSGITVSEKEIAEKMEDISSQAGITEVNLSEIVLPVDDPDDEDRIKALAYKLVDEIRKGSDFSAIAKEFSRGNTAISGGDIGWVQNNHLDRDVFQALGSLSVGQITNPVRTSDAYYVVKLNDKRVLIDASEEDSEVGMKQVFVPLQGRTAIEKKRLVALLDAERKKIHSCEEFDAFAKVIGSQVQPKLLMAQLKGLNEDIKQFIEDKRIGEPTPVVESSEGLYVFIVCEKTQATSSLADKDKVLQAIYNKKIDLQSKRYLRDLRRFAFIEIRLF